MTRWVVVGGGAGGCVVAGRLSADPRHEVVLIEAGSDHGPVDDPDDRGPYFADPNRVRTVAVRRRHGGPAVAYRLGRGLGGSSLVNGSIVVPGDGTADGHLLPIHPVGSLGPVGGALLDADDRARPLAVIRRAGRRVTAADAYLRPHLARSNLEIVADVEVDRVDFNGSRAIGVVASRGDRIPADRVVVCAGAIDSPAILARSGVRIDGLGSNLHDHPAVSITLGLDPSVGDPEAHDITAAITAPAHQILAINRLDGNQLLGGLMVGLTKVTSRGTVTIDADGRPVVELAQLSSTVDRERLAAAAAEALDLIGHPAFAGISRWAAIDESGTPATSLLDDRDAILHWVVDRLTGFHHVAGTCARGVVTDERGWVRGHEGLAVCDASLFAEAPDTNIYLSTILLAEELAAGWRDDP